jgi:hypothetical protein
MNLRLVLLVLSVFLSLSISADRTLTNCPSAWSTVSNSPPLEQGLGVNIHFTDPKPGEMKMISQAGFHWIRMDFKWDTTELERGRYDFSAYDRLMQSLDEYGLRALFILDYGNPLYTADKAVRTEEGRRAFAQWAAAAAKHFANRGVVWEIFNEPNVRMFWPPQPNAAEYIALALAVGRAFRAEAPNEKLIGPATSGIDFNFLEACFKAGLLDYWSAVSVHPYRQSDPEDAANDYCRLRQLIDRYRGVKRTGGSDSVIPIISGEWGFSSAWPRMDEARQGGLLARELLTNLANGIPISIWYDWRDDGPDPSEPEHHFGLVRNNYLSERYGAFQPKPAYLAAKTLTDLFSGYSFQKRLAVGSNEDYVLVFTNGANHRMTAWTTSPTSHRIAIPDTEASSVVISPTGETRTAVSSVQAKVVIEISRDPVYIVRDPRSGN